MNTGEGSSSTRRSIYQQFNDYPWNNDSEFQSGLHSILQGAAPDQVDQLGLQAKCFYFSRKYKTTVDPAAYQAFLSQHLPQSSVVSNGTSLPSTGSHSSVRPSDSPSAAEPPAPYPTSFGQIVRLITAGEPIPGIKEVPDTVLEGQASQSVAAKRKKPWETDSGTRQDGGQAQAG